MKLLGFVIVCFAAVPCSGVFDAVNKIEHARLYGNVDKYAYYFVDLVVGTPPQRVSVILDTGSGVCAYPCANCRHCGKHIDPAYDIEKSDTASWLKCTGGRCPTGRCSKDKCSYYQGYTEGSSISGYWFEDMIGIGDMIQQNPMVRARMGCHSDENNLFYTQKANGIMGIGPSGLANSAILDNVFKDHEHVTHKIFSICLSEWGGRFNVGGYDSSYHTAPVKEIDLNPSGFYSVRLSAMKVNGKTISTSWGSTMIDSGTTYTYMRSSNYRSLKSAIESYCTEHGCGGTKHGNCWSLSGGPSKFPDVTVVFGSVETKWVGKAYLFRKGGGDNYCYSFEDDGPTANTVLGATWMIHQEIIFDMPRKKVGIANANCPEHKERPKHVQQVGEAEVEATTTKAIPAPTNPPTLPQTTTVPPTSTPTTPLAATSTLKQLDASTPKPMPMPTPKPTPKPTTSQIKAVPGADHSHASQESFEGPIAGPKKPALTTRTPSVRAGRTTTTPSPLESKKEFDPLSMLKRDPLRFAGAVAVGVVSAMLVLLLFRRCCSRSPAEARHRQLKDADESGMPPQIVGGQGNDAGFDAFVIGDDDDDQDQLSESFELDRLDSSSQGKGRKKDLLDLAFSDDYGSSPGISRSGQGRNGHNFESGRGPLD